MVYQNSNLLNLVSFSNDFLYLVLKPFNNFKNSEIKLGIRLDIQILCLEHFN